MSHSATHAIPPCKAPIVSRISSGSRHGEMSAGSAVLAAPSSAEETAFPFTVFFFFGPRSWSAAIKPAIASNESTSGTSAKKKRRSCEISFQNEAHKKKIPAKIPTAATKKSGFLTENRMGAVRYRRRSVRATLSSMSPSRSHAFASSCSHFRCSISASLPKNRFCQTIGGQNVHPSAFLL